MALLQTQHLLLGLAVGDARQRARPRFGEDALADGAALEFDVTPPKDRNAEASALVQVAAAITNLGAALAASPALASNLGVGAAALALRLQVSPRKLRKLISLAREDGVAICGLPSTGYFVPETAEELQQSCQFLEHRAMHSLRKLSRMRKLALPVLLGQLMLNQA
jgi:hypothetical protein